MNSTIISGAISVKAAIEANVRTVSTITIDKNKRTRDFLYIEKIAAAKNIPVQKANREFINKVTQNTTNGGIYANVGIRKFYPYKKLLDHKNPFIVLLEGIEDPYNFGYTIRNIYAAGATGLIIPERNWTSADDIVIRASAGASEFIPTAITDNFSEFLTAAKQAGLCIVAAERKNAINIYNTNLTMPLVLAIGGQLRGLSHQVIDKTDIKIYIPYGNDFKNAFPAAGACAVIAFEIFRQRNHEQVQEKK